MFALGREPVWSGGTQKVPACSQHIAALLMQGSPFLWKMCLNKDEEKLFSLPFSFLALGGPNEDWYVFLLVFQFKYAVTHFMRKQSLHLPSFLHGTCLSPHHGAIADVMSAEIWGQPASRAPHKDMWDRLPPRQPLLQCPASISIHLLYPKLPLSFICFTFGGAFCHSLEGLIFYFFFFLGNQCFLLNLGMESKSD